MAAKSFERRRSGLRGAMRIAVVSRSAAFQESARLDETARRSQPFALEGPRERRGLSTPGQTLVDDLELEQNIVDVIRDHNDRHDHDHPL